MSQTSLKALVALLSLAAVTTTYADTKTVVRRNNFFENTTDSPWFNLSVSGGALSPSQDVNTSDQTQGHTVSYKPSTGGTQAGQVSSVTVAGNYSIKGFATAASGFTTARQSSRCWRSMSAGSRTAVRL